MTEQTIKKCIAFVMLAIYLTSCNLGSEETDQSTNANRSSVATSQSDQSNLTVTLSETETQTTTNNEVNKKNTGSFILTSPKATEGGTLPVDYTCDGAGATLPLKWTGAPSGTNSFAVLMDHIATPTDIHWYWILWDIPADVTSLPKNVTKIGVLGTNSVNELTEYAPPCSKGPGAKTYTYTVYALSAEPQLSVPANQVDREVFLEAIQDITLASSKLNVTYARQSTGLVESQQIGSTSGNEKRPNNNADSNPGGRTPPSVAIAACVDKDEQDVCEFTAQKGLETGVCENVQGNLTCSPKRGPNDAGQGNRNGGQNGSNQLDVSEASYTIEQAISDKAQGMTIAFDALAFLTGDIGSASFFPPGKVADFWGFQYMRDNDPSEMGHAGDFLTSAALNMLNVLRADQRAQLVELAESQVEAINEYGYKRFILMQAFQNLLEGNLPAGTTSLNAEAVKAYSAELYQLDGQISYERAQLYSSMINTFTADQLAYLDGMKGKGMLEWPSVQESPDLADLDRDVKVAVMTYAADMFSWYVGSVDADVYFCPERHGTYFGSFYLKDIKAMSDPSYAIPTNMTGNLGDEMLATLNSDQAQLITSLVETQKLPLLGIVDIRRQVAIELRKFLEGEVPDRAIVLDLMRQYGELDGEIIYSMAVNFTQVNQSLTSEQKAQLDAIREELLGELSHPSSAYLYSQPIPMPEIQNTDFLFK
jgi:phosphatidylethanolamine-binding protein (PEBP) family uncharacterized protein